MPGWTAQYTDNLDLRRFAERTIQQETPAHLLARPVGSAMTASSKIRATKSSTNSPNYWSPRVSRREALRLTRIEACACANNLYHAFSTVFANWYEDKTLDYLHPDALKTLIAAQFDAALKPADATRTTVLDAALWTEVQAVMTGRFVEIASFGLQFERFEAAWCKWLEANAAIDWTEERLLDRVQLMLETNLLTASVAKTAICECARAILNRHGAAFYQWMDGNLKAGHAFEDLSAFNPPAIVLCAGMSFKPGTAAAISAFLKGRYDAYRNVSYRLWIVVNLLSKLRNTYPGATLHDCDDGSDHNPVRLDNTALGNYPLRTSPETF